MHREEYDKEAKSMKSGYRYLISGLSGMALGAALVYVPVAAISNFSEAYKQANPVVIYEKNDETKVIRTPDGDFYENRTYEHRKLPTPTPIPEEDEEEEDDLGIKLLTNQNGLERVISR